MCLVESVGSPPSTCWPPFCFHTSRRNNFHLPLPRVSLSNQSISRDLFGRGVRDSSLFFSESRRGRYKEEEENGKELERRRRFDRIPLPSKKTPSTTTGKKREKKKRHNTEPCKLAWKMCEKRMPYPNQSLGPFSFFSSKRNAFLLREAEEEFFFSSFASICFPAPPPTLREREMFVCLFLPREKE